MEACPRPDRPIEKIPQSAGTMMHLWVGFGVNNGKSREMAASGSAWGQGLNRKNGQNSTDARFQFHLTVVLKERYLIPVHSLGRFEGVPGKWRQLGLAKNLSQ
jgi:hypothetical protein